MLFSPLKKTSDRKKNRQSIRACDARFITAITASHFAKNSYCAVVVYFLFPVILPQEMSGSK
jgi:hypothetical protein